jgi:flagellar basal-body rod protein FlgC
MSIHEYTGNLVRGNIYSSLDIAASGMTAQRKKMDAVSSNIAHVSVTSVNGGGPYLRRQVIMEPASSLQFADALKRVSLTMKNSRSSHLPQSGMTDNNTNDISFVEGVEVEIPNMKKNVVYDPSHPDAGENGFVTYPDINIIEEMVDLIVASRAFEANVTVINAAKLMISKSLEI